MLSVKNSPTPAPPSSRRIWLTVKGPIPAFKNSKRAITDRKTGLHRTLTRPDVKTRMEEIIESFVSQLYSKSRIKDDGTRMECCQPSSIASSMPADDCLSVIPKGHWDTEYVIAGQEGADIIIEEIP